MRDEINPNHPVTRLLRDNWHAVVAVLMVKFKVTEVEITTDDLVRLESVFPQALPAVVADTRGGKFIVRLMAMDDALELASKEKDRQ